MDTEQRIGGPDAPYRKGQQRATEDWMAPTQRPMRLARMLRLYVAASDGLTQKQVAHEAGVNESTLSRFLSGEQMPDGRAFAALVAWCFGEHLD